MVLTLALIENVIKAFFFFLLASLSFGRTQENFVNYEARASDLQSKRVTKTKKLILRVTCQSGKQITRSVFFFKQKNKGLSLK